MSGPTVVIIGGGVTGLSTAYHLALKRFGQIILLDKGPVGDGSSSRAAAIITGLLWSETGVRVRQIALRRYRELSEELPGYQFQAVGCLNWFDGASWPEREALLPLYDRLGAPYEVLSAAEMNHRWPGLCPPEDFIGLHDPQGGYSEPDDYIPALAAKCRQLGVDIRERQQVTALLMAGGRVRGVRTAAGDVSADAVVCTTYAWTLKVLETAGLQLPIKAFVHQRYVTRPLSRPVAIPAVNANPLGGYVRPAAGGRLLLGIETPERSEWKVASQDFHLSELSASPGLPDLLMSRFRPTVPALGDASWEYERVGLITFSLDLEPILGPVAALPGLFVGVAFHSGGFAYNPASGLLLAEFVADGRTCSDVAAFSPDRFNQQETRAYLGRTVLQRDAGRRRH
ncbi:MAG: FAD-binding oxidoreductase [Planctomycetes bacterium]|nr:FAD-binding oxidoreductase [Planctomycetota bacterium]